MSRIYPLSYSLSPWEFSTRNLIGLPCSLKKKNKINMVSLEIYAIKFFKIFFLVYWLKHAHYENSVIRFWDFKREHLNIKHKILNKNWLVQSHFWKFQLIRFIVSGKKYSSMLQQNLSWKTPTWFWSLFI